MYVLKPTGFEKVFHAGRTAIITDHNTHYYVTPVYAHGGFHVPKTPIGKVLIESLVQNGIHATVEGYNFMVSEKGFRYIVNDSVSFTEITIRYDSEKWVLEGQLVYPDAEKHNGIGRVEAIQYADGNATPLELSESIDRMLQRLVSDAVSESSKFSLVPYKDYDPIVPHSGMKYSMTYKGDAKPAEALVYDDVVLFVPHSGSKCTLYRVPDTSTPEAVDNALSCGSTKKLYEFSGKNAIDPLNAFPRVSRKIREILGLPQGAEIAFDEGICTSTTLDGVVTFRIGDSLIKTRIRVDKDELMSHLVPMVSKNFSGLVYTKRAKRPRKSDVKFVIPIDFKKVPVTVNFKVNPTNEHTIYTIRTPTISITMSFDKANKIQKFLISDGEREAVAWNTRDAKKIMQEIDMYLEYGVV